MHDVPRPLELMLLCLAGVITEREQVINLYLRKENRIREQMDKRPRLTDGQRASAPPPLALRPLFRGMGHRCPRAPQRFAPGHISIAPLRRLSRERQHEVDDIKPVDHAVAVDVRGVAGRPGRLTEASKQIDEIQDVYDAVRVDVGDRFAFAAGA